MLFRSISTTNKQFCISSFDSIDATHSTALVWSAETTKTNSFKAKSDHSTYLHTLVLFSHRFWWLRCNFDFSTENKSKTIGTTRRATWCDVFNSRRSHHRPKSCIWSDWHWNFEFSRMSKFLRKILWISSFKKKNVQNALKLRLNTQKSHHTESVDWYQNEDSIRFIDFTWNRSRGSHGTPVFSVFGDREKTLSSNEAREYFLNDLCWKRSKFG